MMPSRTARNETGDNQEERQSMSDEIDAYLANIPSDMRDALEGLRQTIRAAAPEAVEAMSYGAPAFKYHDRPLVAYGAARNHCSFYVMAPAVMEAIADELEPYDTSKGTIRFAPDAPLPEALVTKLVRARMAQTDARTVR
jgi:uncharacterized protein YdhG (YjbR/CyaY superfamily)